MSNLIINVGDKFLFPGSREYQDDVFIVTRKRKCMDSFVIDAVCDGEESICISVGIDEIERFDE